MKEKGTILSSPFCSDIFEKSTDFLSILGGVPVLNLLMPMPDSAIESDRWFAAISPFGPVY